VALLGPNGAGKTTLLRVLATLSRPTSGLVRVASYQLPQAGASLRADLGVVSHQPLLYGDLTAEEKVRTFSRGMQQRLAIGRAILHNPRILLLDEPHTGLDQEAGEILDSLLHSVALEGRTVVMTSHDLVRAAGLASRVDLLSRGKIAASVPAADLSASDLVDFYRTALKGRGKA